MPEWLTDGRQSRSFIVPENAMRLNDRLKVQQGLFLCPGDIRQSFMENLCAMPGWESADNVQRIDFEMERSKLMAFALRLHRMNMDSGVLFPGLDGFGRSLKDHIPLLEDLAQRDIGGRDPQY
jgi:hypothetical protein